MKSKLAYKHVFIYSPLYDWKNMQKEGFSWWVQRMKRAFDLFDEFRIDHFRGLSGYWAVPAGDLFYLSIFNHGHF